MLIYFPRKPYRIPDQNGKSLYPFPGRNGAKTIPFEATHIYRYNLYKRQLYNFREFTDLRIHLGLRHEHLNSFPFVCKY